MLKNSMHYEVFRTVIMAAPFCAIQDNFVTRVIWTSLCITVQNLMEPVQNLLKVLNVDASRDVKA